MQADWSVEAAADDPAIVAPWSAPDGALRFVDLSRGPAAIDEIPEARHLPALAHALLLLNAAGGPTWTVKCDAWAVPGDELEARADALDLSLAECAAGFASYIDVLLRDLRAFASFPAHEAWVRSLAAAAAGLPAPAAALDLVVRPASAHGRGGFGISAYVYGFGRRAQDARATWSQALAWLAAQLAAGSPSPPLPLAPLPLQ
jgi:hypothetical protein